MSSLVLAREMTLGRGSNGPRTDAPIYARFMEVMMEQPGDWEGILVRRWELVDYD